MGAEVEAINNTSEIDAAFIQSEEHRPKLNAYTRECHDDEIPIIDLSSDSEEELVLQVGKACKQWGFFQVINHGLPIPLLRRIESAARDFFSLPLDEKRKVSRDDQNPLGYYDTELTKNVRDWKEVFDFVPGEAIQLPTTSDANNHQTEAVTNQWPHNPPELREVCVAYSDAARKLSFRLVELIARSLGLDGRRLNEYFEEDISFVRLNYYPACPAPELALGVGRHKDAGALTLLYQDEVGGLQVKRKIDGQWIPAPPISHSFVVNVGDCIQVWSNDRYESVEHRVVVNDTRPRLSIPFFFNPSHSVMVKPLEELVSEKDPPKYREYNWGKFYKRRKDSNFKNLGVENIQIYHFRI